MDQVGLGWGGLPRDSWVLLEAGVAFREDFSESDAARGLEGKTGRVYVGAVGGKREGVGRSNLRQRRVRARRQGSLWA